MATPNQVKVQRAEGDVSPKVTLPAVGTAAAALVAAAISVLNGESVGDPIALVLAAVAVVQFVVGYFKADKIDLDELEVVVEPPR